MSDPIEPMEPLDPHLLEVLRVSPAAPADARSRVRARLDPLLSAAAAAAMVSPKADARAARSGMGPLAGRTGLAASFLLGGITGALLSAAIARSPAPRIVYVDRPVSAPLASTSVANAATASSPVGPPEPSAPTAAPLVVGPELAPSAAPSAPPPVRPAATTAATSPSPASHFAEERQLLDEARAGLVQGDPGRALERLEQHRARFPDGLLAEERDAMQIQALVRAGRYEEAKARAAVFRARSASSLFLGTVESAISSIP